MGFKPTRRAAALVAAGLVSTLALAACASTDAPAASSTGSGGGKPVTLSLVAYSTPQAAYEKLITAFQKTDAGKNVTFTQSYGASGDQSRAVAAGLTADVVAFSLETDMTRLVKANLVAADWNTDQYKGMVTDSVVVIGTRKGNPKNIKTWDDLTKPGVEVITPNPFTSGGARWNIMAALRRADANGQDRGRGHRRTSSAVQERPGAGRQRRASRCRPSPAARATRSSPTRTRRSSPSRTARPIDYVVPDTTILIENPAAVTSDSKHPKEAKAFLDFLHTPAAQKIFADNGYRPVVAGRGAARPSSRPRRPVHDRTTSVAGPR